MLAVLTISCTAAAVTAPGDVVNTTLGLVQGVLRGKDVRFFPSIPFAAPPMKHNRFRAPQPGIPWSGVRSPLIPNRQCPQMGILGHEDCLLLHVAVPSECTPMAPCAVIFWVYGGAFVLGSDEEYGFGAPGPTAAASTNLGWCAHPPLRLTFIRL